MGGFVPPHVGATSAGGQSVNGGGSHEGGHRPYGGDLTLIDYITMSIAAITQCNLRATILLKLVDLYLITFKFAQ